MRAIAFALPQKRTALCRACLHTSIVSSPRTICSRNVDENAERPRLVRQRIEYPDVWLGRAFEMVHPRNACYERPALIQPARLWPDRSDPIVYEDGDVLHE